MAIRVGFLGIAHMHSWAYAGAIQRIEDADCVGFWEEEDSLANEFAKAFGLTRFSEIGSLIAQCDAVIITSENARHAELGILAARANKDILCEKPLVTCEEEGVAFLEAVAQNQVQLMTAFPCPFSPVFQRLMSRVDAGDIGRILAVNATNRGTCPFGWFIDPEKSGGGAMIDHVVHVADLLYRLLGSEPTAVSATVGNNMYGEDWEDTAMLTLDYNAGVFATIDSSWSRTPAYKTWGDVSLTVVGESGTVEANLFAQQFDAFGAKDRTHSLEFYGSDLDERLVRSFFESIASRATPPVTGEDGLRACRVAFAAYRSAKGEGASPSLSQRSGANSR